jgi:protein-tyrosine phosphatase
MSDDSQRTAILFVCMGNLCRSPLAEGVFRHKATERGVAERFHIESAGTGGWHAGEPADHRVCEVAVRNGVTLDGTARQITRHDFSRFDHILCMDEDNREDLLAMGVPREKLRLLLECDRNASMHEVPDPYYGGAEGFELVYRLVDAACDALLEELLADGEASATSKYDRT